MSNLLLDYIFKISAVTPVSPASTGFLKKVCIVVKPLNGGVTTGVMTACTVQSQIAVLTANVEAQRALSGGLSSVFILPTNDLDLVEALEGHESDFWTLLISSDFDGENEDVEAEGTVTITSYANLIAGDAFDEVTVGGVTFVAQAGAATPGTATFRAATSNDATATSLALQINEHEDLEDLVEAVAVGAVVTITALDPGTAGNLALAYSDEGTATIGATVSGATMTGGTAALAVGTFDGVKGFYNQDADEAAAIAAVEKQAGFLGTSTDKAKNMMFAFGKMLSNSLGWRNQQYIAMPFSDGVTTLGVAEALFEDRVSFSISSTDYGDRLSLFAAGGKAIVAPYIVKNLQIDLQSAAVVFISANQPQYTKVNATLLENSLKDVIQLYIDRQWIEAGTVEVKLEQANFVASGYINIAEPKALWRVVGEMSQTL